MLPTEEEIENNPELESKLHDYAIDDDLIYMGFAWSEADKACERVEELAYQYGLGYFDMFNVYLDRETVIEIPQISRGDLNSKMNIKNTSCYAFFLITSAGYLDYDKGFIPEENSVFDPDVITDTLGIEPFEIMRFGALKPNGKRRYNFSSWYGCK